METLAALATSAFILGIGIWYLVLAVHTSIRRSKLAKSHGCLTPPALPQKDPLFGLDLLIPIFRAARKNQRQDILAEQIALHGNTFKSTSSSSYLGQGTRFTTVDPANIRAAWSSPDFGVAPIRRFAMMPFCGEASMTTDGPAWHASRALLRPIFGRAQYSAVDLLEGHFRELLARVPEAPGEAFDLAPLLGRMELDATAEFVFGLELGSQAGDDPAGERFRVQFRRVLEGMGWRSMMPVKLDVLHRDPGFRQACRDVHRFVDDAIAQAVERRKLNGGVGVGAAGSRKIVMVDALLSKTSDVLDIRRQLINAFLPAHDTTAVLISNVMFDVSRQPRVWEKLREEVCTAVGTEVAPTFDMLNSARLPYLHAVINESLRLRPPITTMGRIALKDAVLPSGGGQDGTAPVLVKKGERVMASFKYLHRRRDLYGENAEQFWPERWLMNGFKLGGWDFVPFGGGLRHCPGMGLALADAAYVLVRFAQLWRTVRCRDEVYEYVESFRMVTESKRGVLISVSP